MWHFFLGQSTALTSWANQACTLFLSPSHFFQTLSLSHLYTHISCSSTNPSCKVNVSVERSLYMKTNEQVHSDSNLIFTPTEFFFSNTNLVFISQRRWIYPPPAPLQDWKPKKNVQTPFVGITINAGGLIRGHRAPLNGGAESDILGTSCTFQSRPIIQRRLLISPLWFLSVGAHVWADGESQASRDTPSSFLVKNKQPERETPCF